MKYLKEQAQSPSMEYFMTTAQSPCMEYFEIMWAITINRCFMTTRAITLDEIVYDNENSSLASNYFQYFMTMRATALESNILRQEWPSLWVQILRVLFLNVFLIVMCVNTID